MNIQFAIFLLLISLICKSQGNTDSVLYENQVTVTAFGQNSNYLKSTVNSKILNVNESHSGNNASMLAVINTVAGVKIEERSPGSYRLNIRNSSLRSPFGVRNVKVYWNHIPLSDANGNTYFNQLATNSFTTIEIVKGPTASMYGAGTGGLLILKNKTNTNRVKLDLNTGSFNTNNLFLTATNKTKDVNNYFSIAINSTDGYRKQTELNRKNLTYVLEKHFNAKHQLQFGLLFTDLFYQTPGGLTLAEFEADPTAARPATGIFPSAIKAKAAIYQQTAVLGITNVYRFNKYLKKISTIFVNNATVKNAAIRNYEIRKEPNIGARSFFTYEKNSTTLNFKIQFGLEVQKGNYTSKVFNNKLGQPDTLQTNNGIENNYGFYFVNNTFEFKHNWTMLIGASVNTSNVLIKSYLKNSIKEQSTKFKNEVMPRLALRKLLINNLSFLATISKGFSPPTVGEILPSTNIINTTLTAESGWNYEKTVQYHYRSGRHLIMPELTLFHFNLNNAIVQKRDASGADYFENAGKVKQQGLEMQLQYVYFKNGKNKFDVNQINLNIAITKNNFLYKEYIKLGNDFSGKKLPSIPQSIFNMAGKIEIKNGLIFQSNIAYVTKMYLNDANTAFSKAYTLLTSKINYPVIKKQKHKLDFYVSADNILNQNYSLGFDINAVNNRFYNAAPKINYAIGVSLLF